jgi:hypothetical protein
LPVAEITAPNSVRPFSSTNILQATCSKGSALSWKVTGSGWSIGGSCETNQITFSAGCADSSGTFTLLVSSPGGCTNIYDVTLVARAEESQAGEALVSLTQGFYGNSGGAFNETRSPDLITNLLPITVGKRGVRSLTIPKEAARWITARLPAGGGASALPNFGDQILDAATGQTTPALNVSSRGKFVGVLLGQTIALSLNTRLDPDLLNFELQNSFSTQGALPGADHLIGTADDVRDVLGPDGLAATGDELATFAIPPTVLTALDTFSLGRSVSGLLELANRALAGMSLSGASLGDVNAAVDAINRGFDEGRFPAAAPAAPTSSGSNDYQSSSWLGNTPALKMQRGADGTVVASWPAVHTNYVLQTSNPGGTNWSNIATSPVILKNRCFVTNSVTGSIQFFRLIKP